MASRSQRASEAFTAYIQDIIWLYCRVNPDILEDDKISHHMKGVAEDAFQLLVVNGSLTVAAFSVACKAFEEAQRSHLDKSDNKRLPSCQLLTVYSHRQSWSPHVYSGRSL